MIINITHALWKRQADTPPEYSVTFPDWAWAVFLVDLIVLLPIYIILNYTFQKLIPILAIVEDEKPPVYEPIAAEPLASNDDPNVNKSINSPAAPFADGRPVTSSFRATWRLLRSTGGFRALFRGFPCFLAQGTVHGLIVGVIASLPGGFYLGIVGNLIASLLLVQLSTAWVHIIMTPRSALHFWNRMLPFKYTFIATWKPTVLFWAVTQLIQALYYPISLAFGIGRNVSYTDVPKQSEAWRGLAAIVFLILVQIFVMIPAYVILVRVQASLLPEDTETIVPFDRSFNGHIEPAVIGGRGHATVRDAWVSFSKPAWRRVMILYVKLTAIIISSTIILGAIIIPQIYLMAM